MLRQTKSTSHGRNILTCGLNSNGNARGRLTRMGCTCSRSLEAWIMKEFPRTNLFVPSSIVRWNKYLKMRSLRPPQIGDSKTLTTWSAGTLDPYFLKKSFESVFCSLIVCLFTKQVDIFGEDRRMLRPSRGLLMDVKPSRIAEARPLGIFRGEACRRITKSSA
jgi:hypothetical protein